MKMETAMKSGRTAIVTGACSGIGLAITRSLLAKSDPIWHVVLVDFRPEAYKAIAATLDQDYALFIEADVSKWEDNARVFKEAYEWNNGNRIDFFHANAGTGDKETITQTFDLDAEPMKPDLSCFDVNLFAVFYGLKLMIHYARKTKRDQSSLADTFHPKVVITSSCTAQYPFPVAPQYAAGKASLLSLTRSIGPLLMENDNIAVNCIMPAYVATNITPPGLNEAWPQKWITPVGTMARAIDELISETGEVMQDGLSDGKDGVIKTGQSVECVIDKLLYRSPVEYPDDSQRFLIEESLTKDGLWATYVDRAFREAGGVGISRS